MYTKIIKNTNLVYILYTEIVQIKILYDNECTKNVYTSNSYICKNMKQPVQNLYKGQTKNDLKLEMYVKNNEKPVQLLNETAFVCFLYIKIMYKLYKTYIYN